MTFLGIHFSFLELFLAVVLLLAFGVQLYYYLYYFRGVIRHNKRSSQGKIEYNELEEGVSIIICARDEEENLKRFLPLVLEQDYPNYEVIVVNDASIDNTEDYLDKMKESYPYLRTSFIPTGATNLSTKKLGLSLGIKAAKNELLLFTDADCIPKSNQWIKKMMRNFTDETEFVIGYGGYSQRAGFLNKLIKYDTLFIAMQYLGMAFYHKTYMGVGRNMAYRKSTFNALGGFAGTLNLKSGDDDLLINKGAKKGNVRIETHTNSTTWSEPNTNFDSWLNQKRRHLSVSNRYTKSSKIRVGMEPVTRGLFYLTLILISFWGNWYIILMAGLLFLVRYILQFTTINRVSKILGDRRFYLSVLLFDVLLPLISFKLMFFEKKNKNIRWK